MKEELSRSDAIEGGDELEANDSEESPRGASGGRFGKKGPKDRESVRMGSGGERTGGGGGGGSSNIVSDESDAATEMSEPEVAEDQSNA